MRSHTQIVNPRSTATDHSSAARLPRAGGFSLLLLALMLGGCALFGRADVQYQLASETYTGLSHALVQAWHDGKVSDDTFILLDDLGDGVSDALDVWHEAVAAGDDTDLAAKAARAALSRWESRLAEHGVQGGD